MYAEIREALFGRDYETIDATLHGYSTKTVTDLPYPALKEEKNSTVQGFILKAVSLSDTLLLDKFQEDFTRKLIQVQTQEKTMFVNTYMPKPDVELSETTWHANEFVYVEFYLETVIPEFFNTLSE